MSNTPSISHQATASSRKMLQAMVGIGVLCAFMIVMTFELTLPRIEKNKAAALEKAIFKVLPDISKKTTFRLDAGDNTFTVVGSEKQEGQLIHAGYDENDHLIGFAVEASGLGFADVLRILYGYDPKQEIIVGFYVLESKETPGLGDKIEKDEDFLANFKALDVSLNAAKNALNNTVIPVKHGDKKNAWEVDGITGATISSRAIGNIIGESTTRVLPLIHQNQNVFTTKKNSEKAQQ